MNHDKRLFLLDAYALIYRAYFALSKNPIHNSKGLNTSAIFGFTNTLVDLMQKEKPTHIAVVFDKGKPDRTIEHEFYKANRQETPEDIITSEPYIRAIIEALDIPIIELEGYEADDLIGTIAKKAEQHSYTTYMVTPDKDFGQLVSDKIFIWKPPYMGRPYEVLGVKEVCERWQIDDVKKVIDILGLMGDAVDNIPGIPGVGEKTAIKLVNEFGSVENLLANTDKLTGKLKERVEENKELAVISKKLATIVIDAPVEVEEEKLVITAPHKEQLTALFSELEFRTLGKRILGDEFSVNQPAAKKTSAGQSYDMFSVQSTDHRPQTTVGKTGNPLSPLEGGERKQGADAGGETLPRPIAIGTKGELEGVSGKNISNTPHEYTLTDSAEKRKTLIEQLLLQKEFCFDTETTSVDATNCDIVGLSFSFEKHKGYYIPFPDNHAEAKKILHEFKTVFESKHILKIGQNIKFDIIVLKGYEIEVEGAMFDTMIAHFLLDAETRHNMNVLAENYLGYSPVSIETLIGKKGKNQGSMRDVELEQIKEYAVEDADITLQLKEIFAPKIIVEGYSELFHEIETPLIKTLADMEFEGVKVDVDYLNAYSKELERDSRAAQLKVFEIAGVQFNLDSPKQLGDVLFEKMKIPYEGKKTKTGQYATGEEVLSKLAYEHDIARLIQDYRELVKLKSTYVDALPALVNPKTKRIHTTFNQTIAATGRLSSVNPNLQNIPIRTENGRKVRKAFIPRNDDYVILSADYSQIELRLVAAISKDEAMLEAFNNDLDIHLATAAKVYGVPLEEVTKEMRSNAKMVNFGIIYGISAFGLSQRSTLSRTEAKEIIENYFKTYPGIKKYMDDAVLLAKEKGYAETLKGRKRKLPDIKSANHTVRGFAERNAINTPIQGTAADMIKIAMNRIHAEFAQHNFKSRMTLQVHDELVFDAHKDEVATIKPIIEHCMKTALELPVPIKVEMGVGNDWLEAH
jgi:DNA polymerase I